MLKRKKMKNKLMYAIAVFATSIFLYSCEDFIEADLGNKSVTVLAPANNTVSSSYSQLFKWEDLKGAEKYQLQIVKPNFSSITQFILDTTTANTQFAYTLLPGSYQWRVRAMNNSSMTEYQTFNLTIDSTLDLSSSSVVLISPADNYYTNVMTNTFSWQTMPNADTYVLQILSGTSTISIQSFPVTTGNYTFTAEGVYQWRVYAQNSSSNSAYSTRTITIDQTAPSIPAPVFPVLDTITANPIPLQWNTSSSADSSHLLISTDSLFAVVTTKDTVIANTGTAVTYNFYSATIGINYFWKVQDVDKAGNSSAYFTRRRIKRN